MGRPTAHPYHRFVHASQQEIDICMPIAQAISAACKLDSEETRRAAISAAATFGETVATQNSKRIRTNTKGMQVDTLSFLKAMEQCLQHYEIKEYRSHATAALNVGYFLLYLPRLFASLDTNSHRTRIDEWTDRPVIEWSHWIAINHVIQTETPRVPIVPLNDKVELDRRRKLESMGIPNHRPDDFYDFVHSYFDYQKAIITNICVTEACFQAVVERSLTPRQLRLQAESIALPVLADLREYLADNSE